MHPAPLKAAKSGAQSFDLPFGLPFIDPAAERRKLLVHPASRRIVDEEIGVDRRAMAADSDSRLKQLCLVIGICRSQDRPDIDAGTLGEQSKFVGEGDMDIA